MNDRYFGCIKCKELTDAGYRWAYATLEEPKVVKSGQSVDVSLLLAASEFWSPLAEDTSPRLVAVLSAVRGFLMTHAAHGIRYGEDHHLFDADSTEELAWLETGPEAHPTLRSIVAEHTVRSLADLESLLGARPELQPWWWGTFAPDDIEQALQSIGE
jgi:hypothetical protein